MTYKQCNGKIAPNGQCTVCGQTSLISSGYCANMLPDRTITNESINPSPKNAINLSIDPVKEEVFVLIEYSNDRPEAVLGVVTDKENAIALLDEYYGIPFSSERDIRDSGVEYVWTYHVEPTEPWNERYTAIVYMNSYLINELV